MFIDFSSRPPGYAFESNPSHLANYRRVYRNTESEVESSASGDDDALARYLSTYESLEARAVVLKARDVGSTFGFRIANEDVAEFCHAHGPRYIGFAGVDPHKGPEAVVEFEHAVRKLGLRGLNIQGFEHQLTIDDERLYPLYEKCVELDVPVNIHCGTNFSAVTAMNFGSPIALDRVMIDFPELRVCASPPGWPWVHELLAVAWRHPNVWIGTLAMRPRLMTKAHSGYEPLLQYGRTVLQDRMIFGSAYPMMPIEKALGEFEALPIEPDIKQKWLQDNAARFLRIEPKPS